MKTSTLRILLLAFFTTNLCAVTVWRHQHSLATSLSQSLDDYVDVRREEQIRYHNELILNVRNEVEKENFKRNLGLIDTLGYIGAQTTKYIQETDNHAHEEISAWRDELEQIYMVQIRDKDWAVPFEGKGLIALSSPIKNKLRLLEWEDQAFDIFSNRLGVISCFGGPLCLRVEIEHEASRDTLREGEIYQAGVRIGSDVYGTSFLSDKGMVLSSRVYFTTSVLIPTRGLLSPGETRKEIPFSLSSKRLGQMYGPSAGEAQFSFTVVKK